MAKNKTVDWLLSQEHPDGGIYAWPGAVRAYPEVTGYLIPTLLNYGEDSFALRCGMWLMQIQNPDGSFDGLHGGAQAFDTAAVVEGLRALKITGAERKALKWLESQLVGDFLKTSPASNEVRPYNLRALAIMGRKIPGDSVDLKDPTNRSHYFLYALEGLLNMGYANFVRDTLPIIGINKDSGLVPYTVGGSGSDTCATAQAACLRLRVGLPAEDYVEAVRSVVNADGSLPHDKSDARKIAWACKYYLDMESYYERKSDL